MVEALAVLLASMAVGSVWLALAPLRRRPQLPLPPEEPAENDLIAAREAALQTIRDLDFDYQLGNLAGEDYHQLRDQHKREAISLLQATNGRAHAAEDPVEAAIEAAVARVRAERRAPRAGVGIAGYLGGNTPPAARGCPRCQRPAAPDDRYCAACGAALLLSCPSCGTEVRAKAEFCARCGHGLANGTVLSVTPTWPSAPARPPALPASPAMSPVRGPGSSARRRPIRWVIGAGVVMLAVVAGVAWLYVAGRSTQQEQSAWAQLPTSVQDFHAVAFVPGREGSVLFGHHDGLLASQDAGRSWDRAAVDGDAMAIVAPAARPGVIYVAGHDLFMKSADVGQSWTPVAHDLPGTDIHALVEDPDNPSMLYAVVAGQGLFRSDDGGTRWTLVADQVQLSATGLARTGGTHPAFYLATADQGVLASADGRGWANANGFVNGALPTVRISALVYDPRSGDRYAMPTGTEMTGALYAGTDRGLFKSIDGGNSWNRLSLQTDVAAMAVSPEDSRTILVVDTRGRIFRSSDGGVSWKGER